MSSNSNAIASQVLFSKFESKESDVHITCHGLLFGRNQDSEGKLFKSKATAKHIMAIGLLHYVGSLCTNMGFAYGSASLVQCVKLLEPIETLVLVVIAILVRDNILSRSCDTTKLEIQQILSVRKVTSTLVIIGGTMMLLGQKSMEPNPKSIVFALVSGFCMASRNVLKKTTSSADTKQQSETKKSSMEAFVEGVQSFAFITFMSAIPSLAVTLICYIYEFESFYLVVSSLLGSESDIVQYLMKSVIFHCGYNVFSITVLSLTSATTHSLLNVGKRIVNVLTAAAYFGVALSLKGKCGIALAAVGAFLYNDNSVERIKNTALGKYLDISQRRKLANVDASVAASYEDEEIPLVSSEIACEIRTTVRSTPSQDGCE
jgi:drug/metabolite transporter (DMT)-like permease